MTVTKSVTCSRFHTLERWENTLLDIPPNVIFWHVLQMLTVEVKLTTLVQMTDLSILTNCSSSVFSHRSKVWNLLHVTDFVTVTPSQVRQIMQGAIQGEDDGQKISFLYVYNYIIATPLLTILYVTVEFSFYHRHHSLFCIKTVSDVTCSDLSGFRI
jgi:hypothetical protein